MFARSLLALAALLLLGAGAAAGQSLGDIRITEISEEQWVEVKNTANGPVVPGQVRELVVDGNRLSSGAYFVQIVGERFRDTRRLVVAE